MESVKRRPVPEHVPGTQVNNSSGPLKVAKIGVPEDDKTSVVIRKNMHEPPGSPFQQTTIPVFPNYKFHPEKRLLGKPTYTIHIVNTSTKRRLNDQLKNILSIASPTKCIGAVIELDGKLSIEGYREKYEEPLRLIKKQFKTANPALSNFAYSNALLTTDVENAAMSICAEAVEGRRTLWAWSEDGVLWAKLDGSRWMNIHGKLLSWVGSAALKFKSPAEAKTYLVYTYRLSGLCEVEKTERATLDRSGFCPNGIHHEDSSDSDTTIPEEDQELDQTEDLPPIIMSEEWRKEGPPAKGSGWLGIGPPIQVHHNYRTQTLEDGAGICSPGRWRPGYRNLPDVGNLCNDLIKGNGDQYG